MRWQQRQCLPCTPNTPLEQTGLLSMFACTPGLVASPTHRELEQHQEEGCGAAEHLVRSAENLGSGDPVMTLHTL